LRNKDPSQSLQQIPTQPPQKHWVYPYSIGLLESLVAGPCISQNHKLIVDVQPALPCTENMLLALPFTSHAANDPPLAFIDGGMG
jgi:hypothetical protein